MGLNLSNLQVVRELGLNNDDAQQMARRLRSGIADKKPVIVLEGEVGCGEVYVAAGHKGSGSGKKSPEKLA